MSFLAVPHSCSWNRLHVFLDCSTFLSLEQTRCLSWLFHISVPWTDTFRFLEQTTCLSWLFHISFPRTDYMLSWLLVTVPHFCSWNRLDIFFGCSTILFLEQTACLSWLFHISFPGTNYMFFLDCSTFLFLEQTTCLSWLLVTVPHFCSWNILDVFLDCFTFLFLEQTTCLFGLFHISVPGTE